MNLDKHLRSVFLVKQPDHRLAYTYLAAVNRKKGVEHIGRRGGEQELDGAISEDKRHAIVEYARESSARAQGWVPANVNILWHGPRNERLRDFSHGYGVARPVRDRRQPRASTSCAVGPGLHAIKEGAWPGHARIVREYRPAGCQRPAEDFGHVLEHR